MNGILSRLYQKKAEEYLREEVVYPLAYDNGQEHQRDSVATLGSAGFELIRDCGRRGSQLTSYLSSY